MSMPPVLTEAVSSRSRHKKSEKQKAIGASNVLETLEQHILLDGLKVVIDLEKSTALRIPLEMESDLSRRKTLDNKILKPSPFPSL
jgi:hypothetical protein